MATFTCTLHAVERSNGDGNIKERNVQHVNKKLNSQQSTTGFVLDMMHWDLQFEAFLPQSISLICRLLHLRVLCQGVHVEVRKGVGAMRQCEVTVALPGQAVAQLNLPAPQVSGLAIS